MAISDGRQFHPSRFRCHVYNCRNLARVTRVGLDLAKNVFPVHAVDAAGEIVTLGGDDRRTEEATFDEVERIGI